jgi:hypothetical protein
VKVLAGLCVLGAGCFYLDPLNKPPNLIVDCELTDDRPCHHLGTDVFRGDRIRLRMAVSDPDGNEDPASYGWEAFACDSTTGSLCDTEPFDAQHYDEPAERGLDVEVPATLPGGVRSISVDFQAGDDRGGLTKQSLIFHLANAPTLPRNASDAFAAPESRTMYVRSQ